MGTGEAAGNVKQLGVNDELPRLTVYVVSPPMAGHYMPLISLAAELHSRGHNVTFFTPIQTGNEDAPTRTLREAGVPFIPLGISPLNKTEFEAVLDEMHRGTNLLGIVKTCLDADVAAYVDMDRLLSERAIPVPDVLVACAVMQGTGTHIGLKHGVPTVLNYPYNNYFWRPPWPFPVLGSGLSDRLTFPQRLKNELVNFVNSYVLEPYLLSIALPDILARRGVPIPAGGWWPSLFSPRGTPSILNSAPGFDFPAPLPPNVIQPGPLIMSAAQTVPESLQTWLDSKPERSVVVVSLGTTSYIDHRIARLIIEGLAAAGNDVLWVLREAHWKALAGLEVPGTFRLEKWIPQRAVLAHWAVAAMLTHCGNSGVQEALANAVPAVGIPFFADQVDVAARLASAGFPVLDLSSVTASQLMSAVREVTSLDPDGGNEYREKARRVARIYRAHGGVRKAADFVEHIAELGEDHLQMAVFSMPWYVRHRYDTGLVFLLLAGVLLSTVGWLFRACRTVVISERPKRPKSD